MRNSARKARRSAGVQPVSFRFSPGIASPSAHSPAYSIRADPSNDGEWRICWIRVALPPPQTPPRPPVSTRRKMREGLQNALNRRKDTPFPRSGGLVAIST